ncbi:alpha/beta hydrolase [Pseudonocardia ailaonensis]|uniref:Alpha/beta hydrolase n=1 Tax=Pseudonocardia ailaonensis TaxID=367279 RepID=A0ABN2N1N5_9PSEU
MATDDAHSSRPAATPGPGAGEVQVLGDSGPAVLLLPGGAETCDGFFPGLVEGLIADPGCRVIVHDRPGTGRSMVDGDLAGASAHLHALIAELGLGPVVVVGQSLGGAVAVLLARDHPEDLAGLVLLDASPINDPASCRQMARTIGPLGAFARLPVAGKLASAGFRALGRKQMREVALRPDCAAAMERTLEADMVQLAKAAGGIDTLAANLHESDLPRLPSVVVTADRPPGSAVRKAHERLAGAFGGELRSWPGATHSVHLDHPDEVLETVREVVRQVG